MEINLKRMNDYNGYNISIAYELREAGLITYEQESRIVEIVEELETIYGKIKSKNLEGYKIIGIS